MKLDPRTWLGLFKREEQEAAYATKIYVVTKCSECPHLTEEILTETTVSPARCGVVGQDIDGPTSKRQSWCPLTTSIPPGDKTTIWEGNLIRE